MNWRHVKTTEKKNHPTTSMEAGEELDWTAATREHDALVVFLHPFLYVVTEWLIAVLGACHARGFAFS